MKGSHKNSYMKSRPTFSCGQMC